jgi:hypothetical protein
MARRASASAGSLLRVPFFTITRALFRAPLWNGSPLPLMRPRRQRRMPQTGEISAPRGTCTLHDEILSFNLKRCSDPEQVRRKGLGDVLSHELLGADSVDLEMTGANSMSTACTESSGPASSQRRRAPSADGQVVAMTSVRGDTEAMGTEPQANSPKCFGDEPKSSVKTESRHL